MALLLNEQLTSLEGFVSPSGSYIKFIPSFEEDRIGLYINYKVFTYVAKANWINNNKPVRSTFINSGYSRVAVADEISGSITAVETHILLRDRILVDNPTWTTSSLQIVP